MKPGATNILYTVAERSAGDLLSLPVADHWEKRIFQGPGISAEIRDALALPPPPAAAIVDFSVDRPLDYARQIRATARDAQLIFACTDDQAEHLPQTIRAFPTIGPHWSVVRRGPKFFDRISQQLEVTARRNRHRTTLDRVNLRLREPSQLDERTLHRLAVSERYLVAIVENAPDAIVTLSAEGTILGWNASASALWQVEGRGAMGRKLAELLDPESGPRFQSLLRSVARSGHFAREEFAAALPVGAMPIEATVTPVFGEPGTLIAFTVIARDITLRKAAEKSARDQTEALERLVAERTARLRETIEQLEQFSYTVSHDLRGPLRAMQGYADALLKDYGEQLPPDARMYAQRIARSAVRMDQLTRDVLAYSRVATVDLRKGIVALDVLIPELTVQLCGDEKAAEVFEIRRPLLPVIGHEPLLAQALSNLINNGMKFVAPGTAPRVRLWTERHGRKVRVHVADNGIGIPPEHAARIFDMFERCGVAKDYEGTGIGLAIVKKAVVRMGGEVGFVSAPQTGTTFWIELPAIS